MIAVGTLLAGFGLSSGSTSAYDAGNPIVTTFTPESNQASYWGAGCTKLDRSGSTSYTATAYHSIVVLKSGNFNYAFYNVKPGDVLTIPQQISHYIFCPPSATTTTTTTVDDNTTTTVDDNTTTTVDDNTTTTVDDSTTTTLASGGNTTTTLDDSTTTTLASGGNTTTTLASGGNTTTTVASGGATTTIAETSTSVAIAGPTTTLARTTTTLSASGAATTTVAPQLPATGTDTTSLLTMFGAGLCVLGLVLVVSARRPELA